MNREGQNIVNGDRFIEFTLWVLCLVLAIVFFYNGVGKIIGIPAQVTKFESLNIPSNMLIMVGIVECLGALMLTIPRLTIYGAVMLGAIMMVSALLHYMNDNAALSIRAAVMVFMLAGIGYLRFKRRPVSRKIS